MQARGQTRTRGACPGAFTPMASGDGWLLRVRTGARALATRELRGLARLAHECGSGIIELTRRANLQLRGLRVERISELQAELIALGLVDTSPVREGRPGLLVDPVAALDDAALIELGLALDEALAESAAGSALSAKLGVVLDAGSGSVAGVDADIRVVASGSAERVQILLGTHAGAQLLGEFERGHAPAAVKALLRALSDFARAAAVRLAATSGASSDPTAAAMSCVSAASPADACTIAKAASCAGAALPAAGAGSTTASSNLRSAPRIRELVAARGVEALRAEVGVLAMADAWPAAQPRAALGFHAADSGSWFGLGVPFGSAAYADWLAIAELAERFGAAQVRLTPGREVLIVGVRPELAERLEQAAQRLGFITAPNDRRRQVAACSGAPACGSAYGETRALASSLLPLLAAGTTLHVSGCEKGCASQAVCDVSIVLAPAGARLALNADVAAASGAPVEALATLTAKLASLARSDAFETPARITR